MTNDNIIIPRSFLEVIEDTLRIQNNINLDKKTGETCQDRNVKQSLNIVRKLLRGEEITGMERLEKLQTAPPGIEEESNKKGWLDYGLTVGEIGLHRYNAIQRIKEHKEKFDKRDIPSGILYHVAEYYENVGKEQTLCHLQAWCRDFRFTQEEVKEIIDKEINIK